MKKQIGFTLIALMIVVAIIAILASVGYSGYTKQLLKAHRSDAQQLLLDIVNKQELYLLDARQYTNSFSTLNISKEGWSCAGTTCSNNFYTVTVSSLDNSASPPIYTVTAAATGTQSEDGNLTINNLGVKTPSDKW